MRSLLLTCFLFCCLYLPAYAQEVIQLDEHASVTLPGATQMVKGYSGNAWHSGLLDQDEKRAKAMATFMMYTDLDITASEVSKRYNDPKFSRQITGGIMHKNAGAKVSPIKKMVYAGMKGYEINVTNKQTTEEAPYTRTFVRILFGKDGVYMLITYHAAGVDGIKEKDKFFRSFKIN